MKWRTDAETATPHDGDPRHGAGRGALREPVVTRKRLRRKAGGEWSPSSQASSWDVAPWWSRSPAEGCCRQARAEEVANDRHCTRDDRGLGPVGDPDPEVAPSRVEAPLRPRGHVGDGERRRRGEGEAGAAWSRWASAAGRGRELYNRQRQTRTRAGLSLRPWPSDPVAPVSVSESPHGSLPALRGL